MKKQNGLMLTELIIVLALIGIVLATGYMVFSFGATSFARGEKQSIAQQSIRSGADFITSEIRYANYIALLESDTKPAGYHYIYQLGNSIIHRDPDGIEKIILDNNEDNIEYSVAFTEKATYENKDFSLIISYLLEAEDDLYYLDTSVHILNLDDINDYDGLADPDNTVSTIQYKKPWEN